MASAGLEGTVPSLHVWGGRVGFRQVTEKLVGNPAGLGAGQEEDAHPHRLGGGAERPPECAAAGSSGRGMVWEGGAQPWNCLGFPP